MSKEVEEGVRGVRGCDGSSKAVVLKAGAQTSSISIPWELIRNAKITQVPGSGTVRVGPMI